MMALTMAASRIVRPLHAKPAALQRAGRLFHRLLRFRCGASDASVPVLRRASRPPGDQLSLSHALPRPVGIEGGGVGNGIVGSLIIVGIATLIATPVGVLSGIFSRSSHGGISPRRLLSRRRAFRTSEYCNRPIRVYASRRPIPHFSAVSASFAFAILMLPITFGRLKERSLRCRDDSRGCAGVGTLVVPRDDACCGSGGSTGNRDRPPAWHREGHRRNGACLLFTAFGSPFGN